jgi:cation:H+ antiporter
MRSVFDSSSVILPLIALVAAAGVLLYVGPRLTRVVDALADVTGWGEAMAGAVLLGAATSLPGLVTTVVAAVEGRGTFAVSNALGGIAAQTIFIAIADLGYRKVNLEHAAASMPNLLQSTIVLVLLGLVMVGTVGPDLDLGWVHPVSVLLVITYVYGFRLIRQARTNPMWRPEETAETELDEPDPEAVDASPRKLWASFAAFAAVVAGTGFVIGQAGMALADATPLSDAVVAVAGTAIITSLPELVTTVAAVRQGAVNLGIADIIGGNSFDVLFVAAADLAFTEGSIYAELDRATVFMAAITIVLTAVFAAGLLHRERRGIGFEGLVMFVVYGLGIVAVAIL